MKKFGKVVACALLATTMMSCMSGVTASAASASVESKNSVAASVMSNDLGARLSNYDKIDKNGNYIIRFKKNYTIATLPLTITKGDKGPLNPWPEELDASNFTITSSDTYIAEYNSNTKKVVVKNPGYCTITVKQKNTNKTKKISILASVDEKALSVSVPNNYEFDLYDGRTISDNLIAGNTNILFISFLKDRIEDDIYNKMTVKFNDRVINKKYYTINTTWVNENYLGDDAYLGLKCRIGLVTKKEATGGVPLFYNEKILERYPTEVYLNNVSSKSKTGTTTSDPLFVDNASGSMRNTINTKGIVSKDSVVYMALINNLVEYDRILEKYTGIKTSNLGLKVVGTMDYNNRKILKLQVFGYNYDKNSSVPKYLVNGTKTFYGVVVGDLSTGQFTIKPSGKHYVASASNNTDSVYANYVGGYSVKLTQNKQYKISYYPQSNGSISELKGIGKNKILVVATGCNNDIEGSKSTYVDGYAKAVPYSKVSVNSGSYVHKYSATINASKNNVFTIKFDKTLGLENYIDNKKLTVSVNGQGVATFTKVSESARYLTYKITINKTKIPKTGSKLVMISLVNTQGLEVSYARFTVKY